MGWFADRRQARLETETEQRLRRLIVNAGTVQFYIPADWVRVLGTYKVNVVLSEYGLPAVVEEREQAA